MARQPQSDKTSTIDFLKKVALLADLSSDDLEHLMQMSEVVNLPAGAELFAEGSLGDRVYIIKEGEIEILKATSEGQIPLAVRKTGEVIGEMALLHQVARMASALARTDSLLLAINQEQFNHLLDANHPATRAILHTVMSRWQETEQVLLQLRNQEMSYLRQIQREKKRADDLLHVMIPLGVSLVAEQDFDRLLERILQEAILFCQADAGTLYLRTPDDCLEFVIVHNNSLKITMGGTTGQAVSFAPLPLYDQTNNEPNYHNVATYAVLKGVSVNIPDAYQVKMFDFSGTKAFDAETGYRSKSFLTIPLKNSLNQVIGVLQLINAKEPETNQVCSFDPNMQQMMESFSSLAVVALEAYIREQGLKQQIQQLRIEVDEVKRQKQVSEIVDTDFFHDLQVKAHNVRSRRSRTRSASENKPDNEPTLG
jgi:CRP-like cAMP-binding protein